MLDKIVLIFAAFVCVNSQLVIQGPPILPPPYACSAPVLPPYPCNNPVPCGGPVLAPYNFPEALLAPSCNIPIAPPVLAPCGCNKAPALGPFILPNAMPNSCGCGGVPLALSNLSVGLPSPCGCQNVPVALPNPCGCPNVPLALPSPCGCPKAPVAVPNIALVSAANPPVLAGIPPPLPPPPCGCVPEVPLPIPGYPVGCTNPFLPAASPVSALAPQVVSPILPPVCPCENRNIYLRKIPIPPPCI